MYFLSFRRLYLDHPPVRLLLVEGCTDGRKEIIYKGRNKAMSMVRREASLLKPESETRCFDDMGERCLHISPGSIQQGLVQREGGCEILCSLFHF